MHSKFLEEKKVLLENYDHVLIQLRKLYGLYRAQKTLLEEIEKEKAKWKSEISRLETERDMLRAELSRFSKRQSFHLYNVSVRAIAIW